jgi:hypothetical protein
MMAQAGADLGAVVRRTKWMEAVGRCLASVESTRSDSRRGSSTKSQCRAMPENSLDSSVDDRI